MTAVPWQSRAAAVVLSIWGAIGMALATASPVLAQAPTMADLRAAASADDTGAQRALAQALEQGDGVLQDFAEAARWYARAAQAGDATAANRLGILYHTGLGVARDMSRALALLEQAAAAGDPAHMLDLALALESADTGPEAHSRAADLYRRAAEAGNLDAAVSLAVLMQAGKGVPQNHAEAARIYTAAAKAGHPRAQNNLGLMYVRGTGVPQDYRRAADLFTAAAEQGLTEALTNLGVLHENGFGVPQSDARAAELYRLGGQGALGAASETPLIRDDRLLPPGTDADARARLETWANAGDPVAEFQLAWLLQDADPRGAATLFRRAAEAGHAPSMVNLGLLYFHGRGVPQDFVLGQMWLVLAGSSGIPGAPAYSVGWRDKMTAAQVNQAQTRAADLWLLWHERPRNGTTRSVETLDP